MLGKACKEHVDRYSIHLMLIYLFISRKKKEFEFEFFFRLYYFWALRFALTLREVMMTATTSYQYHLKFDNWCIGFGYTQYLGHSVVASKHSQQTPRMCHVKPICSIYVLRSNTQDVYVGIRCMHLHNDSQRHEKKWMNE
jgi:hypothetical protein